MNLLTAKNISHKFDYELFDNVSLELNEKESISIIGISGSGKSTLMHILSTLLMADSGEVTILNNNVSGMHHNELSILKRDTLGIVFQSHYLFKGFSAFENLEVSEILSQHSVDKNLLEKLGIEKVIMQKVTELSGGQQQRVSIARVLTKKPRIIFADEPTGNLDKITAHDVMDIFFEYIDDNNAGMILVTHDEELAYKCQKVYRLENRELVREK